MAAIKSVCLVYFVLLSYGICYGGRVLNEEAKKASDNHGTGTMNGDPSTGDRNPDSGDASTDGFRFRGIIGGWNGIPAIEVPGFDIPVIGEIPTIEVPGFDIPVIGIPGYSIPSFSIGGGIDIDFGGSDDPELGKNGGSDTKPGDGGAHDDPKLLPVSPVDGGDSPVRGIKNANKADNENKMQEMMGNAMAPKESD